MHEVDRGVDPLAGTNRAGKPGGVRDHDGGGGFTTTDGLERDRRALAEADQHGPLAVDAVLSLQRLESPAELIDRDRDPVRAALERRRREPLAKLPVCAQARVEQRADRSGELQLPGYADGREALGARAALVQEDDQPSRRRRTDRRQLDPEFVVLHGAGFGFPFSDDEVPDPPGQRGNGGRGGNRDDPGPDDVARQPPADPLVGGRPDADDRSSDG